MKIPHYWAKGPRALTTRHMATGEEMSFSCWGWSDASAQEAAAVGEERTRRLLERIARGERPDRYLYGDQPLREEILEEWHDDGGEIFAAVTRNRYGCQVLNTAGVMFVDLDLAEPSAFKVLAHGVARFCGRRGPTPREEMENAALAPARALAARDRDCGIRVYRTRAGLRYLFTNAACEPNAEATLALMQELGADPLYVKLCRRQNCFRARLTPKPWRCGVNALGITYPWTDERAARRSREWVEEYEHRAERFATCALIAELGRVRATTATARVIAFHDRMTRIDTRLTLA